MGSVLFAMAISRSLGLPRSLAAVYNPGTSLGDSGDSNEIKWNYDVNMKKKWEKIKSQIFKVIITINSHHTGAYAAQAAYFFVLSLIPIFLLLLTMVRFTPITMSEVMTAVLKVFPEVLRP